MSIEIKTDSSSSIESKISNVDNLYKDEAQKYLKILQEKGWLDTPTSESYIKQIIAEVLRAVKESKEKWEEKLDVEQFTNVMKTSWWSSRVSKEDVVKLFRIVTNNEEKGMKLNDIELILTFLWLGNPEECDKADVIPERVAINFYHQMLTLSSKKLPKYISFIARKDIDNVNIKEIIIRLNEGRKQDDQPSGPLYFHRNMVLSNKFDSDLRHRLLFGWNSDKKELIEAADPVRNRYRRRGAPPQQAADMNSIAGMLRIFNATFKKDEFKPLLEKKEKD